MEVRFIRFDSFGEIYYIRHDLIKSIQSYGRPIYLKNNNQDPVEPKSIVVWGDHGDFLYLDMSPEEVFRLVSGSVPIEEQINALQC